MSQTYLMTIALGPVQDFIAAARRLRDLWFGSYLLSELSKQAGRSLHARGGELIFPAPADPETDLTPGTDMNVPNKLLAMVSGDPGEIFHSVKAEIEEFWRDRLAEKTIPNRESIDSDLFKKQIGDFLEIYGAWTPLNGDYTTARKRVDQLLSARKTLRDFNQTPPVTTGEEKGGLPKSSLDGVRESVLSDKIRNRKNRRGIKEGEELDAVGWVKRYGKRLDDEGEPTEPPPVFESLSDLAADPFLRGADERPEVRKRLEALARNIRDTSGLKIPQVDFRPHRKPLGNLAPQILFPTSLKREMDETEKLDDAADRKQELMKAVGQVHQAMDVFPREPMAYTAILVGDGDNMGSAIGDLKDPEAHRRFSRELDDFARRCHEIVEDHFGSLIYSGGDDVMAFIPLDQALSCAEALRQSFAERMKAALPDVADLPTFSAGLAIVHHLRPMNLSLELARRAERLAKSHEGKNALAVILDKRSGAPLERVAAWEDNGAGFVERLLRWSECHRNEWIPDKFGYQLRHLQGEFGDENALEWKTGTGGEESPNNALAYEFIRVLKRKRAGRGSRELQPEHMQQIIQTARSVNRLDALANELILTRLIADSQIQAGMKKEADHAGN
jgi:CRISPR-associated protein Cmr2